jgi:HEAT repeat protein
MQEYILELIARMTATEDRCLNSDDSVAWHAHREAETLSDSSTVDELAEYVNEERNNKRRGAAYFILGRLGPKVRDIDCASILLLRLSDEQDKYVLSSLLDALSWIRKPRSLDLEPVYRLLSDDRWSVRHSAIQSLRLTETSDRTLGEDDRPIRHDLLPCHVQRNR